MCLTKRGQSHNHIAGLYACVVNYFVPFHARGYRRIYNDRTDQITHIGSFSASAVNLYAVGCQFFNEIFRSGNYGRNHFARNHIFVASNGRRKQNRIGGAHTQQIVNIHDECVLGNAFPYRQITSFFPIHIGQRRLGSCAIGMHDEAIIGVLGEVIGNDFAKSFRIQAFINRFYGVVYLFFRSRDAALCVSFGNIRTHRFVWCLVRQR